MFARAALSSVFILLIFFTTNAQTSTLDGITVTAGMRSEKARVTGRNLIIIPGESLQLLPVHSIDELLKFMPGVELQTRGPFGAQGDVTLRGGTFQQVLVLLDGVRVNDPNTGHFSAYIPIAPGEIHHIEILKGAASAIYGSDAVGGVIHVITKTFMSQTTVANNFSATFTGGEHDLIGINAGGAVHGKKSNAAFGILSNNTSGHNMRGTHGSVYANTASASYTYTFNPRLRLSARYAFDHRNFSAQNFYTSFLSDTASEKTSVHWSQLALEYAQNKHRASLSAGFKSFNDTYAFNAASIANQSKSHLLQVLASDLFQISSRMNIVNGLQYINRAISSNDRGTHHVSSAAAFSSLSVAATSRLTINPALRLEWNELSGWILVPQVNLSYHTDRLQLRASAGKTARDADFTERYNNYNKPIVNSGRIGNPALIPERSFSVEAGADWRIVDALKLSVSLFHRTQRNLIDYVLTPYAQMPRKDNLNPAGSYLLARNISELRTAGAELDLQASHNFSDASALQMNLGFLLLHTEHPDSTVSLYVSSHPQLLANWAISYSIKRMQVSATGVYKERKAQPAVAGLTKVSSDYFLANLKIAFEMVPKRLSIFAESDNIFNTHYADFTGAILPGRWLMAGATLKFRK